MDEFESFDKIIASISTIFANLESKAMQEVDLSDLSMKQIVYLDTIATMETATASELAKCMHVSKPSVTAILTKLIHKGFVLKIQSDLDKRAFYLRLTEKGRALNEVHRNLHQKIARYFTQALSADELRVLSALMKKVIEAARL